MKRSVTVEGYLTQAKLASALQQIVGADRWAGDEVSFPVSRRRFDMAYHSNEGTVLVEYDGDEHYRNTLVIKRDREKDQWALDSGFKLVRFPYWLQLDSETLQRFFALESHVEQTFPHGFITTRLFPASFCELGLERFSSELSMLPDHLRTAVLNSLRERASDHGLQYVLPSSLRSLVAT